MSTDDRTDLERRKFRAGDYVHHGPCNEDWVLACDEERGEVICCGWPETFAKATDCTMLEAASDERRLRTLVQVAEIRDELRGSRARRQLEEADVER